ncbi:bifunctional phosphoribosyl-AMP cyclohydrolase/phosphoribosyl-ATP diphosphatase HisIE [Caldanaerobius polysaccharolyticus]|uniref:bifunctional phosphoribosyl-AMP cyclohydrolase/phosphoribosyl-ATP diphosphatase HisIE n=1 Tax=Caldanaerobius polysaccharolyticus TaxID=44256 RepID=UPI000A01F05E|nr:bifunctional phosphoribosyl-AMP cyclohydrolase/phosphoribosyl-ATP diphosphatase HisIE [Caldanaerobius polysaccharolyticus]
MGINLDELKFDENGLIPAVIQDVYTKEVLMLAYMNKESIELTIKTGKVNFYSRSRKTLWLKGETSGNYLNLKRLEYDCDADALLVEVIPEGPVCHTGNKSCFYRTMYKSEDAPEGVGIIKKLSERIADRKKHPVDGSYTNYLLDKGIDKILKKVGEECAETIIAAKNNSPEEITYEVSDLVYHLLVMLAERGVDVNRIYDELARRYKK